MRRSAAFGPALLFALGYLSLGAACLHPSAVQLMNPPARAVDRADDDLRQVCFGRQAGV